MFNTKMALKGSRRLALVVATLAATQIGCGGTANPPQNPPTDTPQAGGDQGDVQVADFEESLGNYGTWVDVPVYGHVWQPADDVAGEDFTPYTSDGSWSAADDGSWVYDSKYDTEYGWATYHYGRWVDQEDYGWVWIPGTEWAPSWVDWRYGGGNVGWVPLGPPGVVVEESRWCFVDQVHFADVGWRTYRTPPERIHESFSVSVSIAVGGGGGGGGGHWSAGPPVASIRAAGGNVRTSHVSKPARGAVKAQAQASVQRAKTSNRPKSAAAPVKRGSAATRAAKGNPGATPAKAGTKPEAGKTAATKPETKPEVKPQTKPTATAAKPKPKPEEEEAAAKAKPKPKPSPRKK